MPPKQQMKSDRLRSNAQAKQLAEEREEIIEENLNQIIEELVPYSANDTKTNEFDNEYTKLLKIAVQYKFPSIYLLEDESDGNVISIFQYYADVQPTSEFLIQIYETYGETFHWITAYAWVYIFILQLSDVEVDDEVVLVQCNTFLNFQDLKLFKDYDELTTKFKQWYDHYKQTIISEHEKLGTVIQAQGRLSTLKPLDTSSIVTTSERYEYKMSGMNKDNFLDVYHQSNVSVYVPWIMSTYDPYSALTSKQFIASQDNILLKTLRNVPTRAWSLYPSPESVLKNRIYFALWVERQNPDVFSGTKESYVLLSIDLYKLTLVLDIPIVKGIDQAMIMDRIEKALLVAPVQQQQKKVSAQFNIYNLHVYEFSFADMIMSDPLFATYLIIDETSTSLARKKRLTIQFKPSQQEIEITDKATTNVNSSVKASLGQLFTVAGQNVNIFGQAEAKTDFPADTPYVAVTISLGRDPKSVELFRRILSRLGTYYNKFYKKFETLYKTYIPETTIQSPLEKRTSTKYQLLEATKKSRNSMLREQAPDVIVKGYSRKCQHNKPIVVQESEKDNYDNVMPFPKDDPKYYFVCPDEEAPYPTIIPNELEKNKHIYPYIPCCAVSDPKLNEKSLYNKIYMQDMSYQDVLDETNVTSQRTLVTLRPVKYKQYGNVPATIKNLLQTDGDEEIIRIGMETSKSSLLHCLYYAVNDEVYMDTAEDEREALLQRTRRRFNNEFQSSVIAQELWDVSPQTRMENIRDPDIYLDPMLYYRALEEIFNVTIWVFSGDGNALTLQQPRCKFFSARYNISRECVIIFNHTKENHCELIGKYTNDRKNIITTHSQHINDKLYNTFFWINKTYTYQKNDENTLSETINTHSTFDDITKFSISHQILDSYGKLRGVVLKEPLLGTILTTPLAPLNAPIWTGTYDDLPRFTGKSTVKKIMDEREPTNIFQDEIVYTENNNFILRFLVNNNRENMIDLPFITENVISSIPYTSIVLEKKKIVRYILQAINILFILYSPIREDNNTRVLMYENIVKFLNRYTKPSVVDNPPYDISKITNPNIPKMTTVDDFFEWWSTICPDMVITTPKNRKVLVMPNRTFRHKLQYHLINFVKIYSGGNNVVIPTVLLNVDFENNNNNNNDENEVMLTSRTLPMFILEKEISTTNTITSTLSEKYSKLSKFYYTNNETTYLIINVDDMKAAIIMGNYWSDKKRLPTLNEIIEDENTIEDIVVNTVKISSTGGLLADETNAVGDEKRVEILKYNQKNRFGVILLL